MGSTAVFASPTGETLASEVSDPSAFAGSTTSSSDAALTTRRRLQSTEQYVCVAFDSVSGIWDPSVCHTGALATSSNGGLTLECACPAGSTVSVAVVTTLVTGQTTFELAQNSMANGMPVDSSVVVKEINNSQGGAGGGKKMLLSPGAIAGVAAGAVVAIVALALVAARMSRHAAANRDTAAAAAAASAKHARVGSSAVAPAQETASSAGDEEDPLPAAARNGAPTFRFVVNPLPVSSAPPGEAVGAAM